MLLITFTNVAQQAFTVQWDTNFGSSEEDNGFAVAASVDGGYAIAGAVNANDGTVTTWHQGYDNFGHPLPDLYVVKVDAEGVMQWQTALGTSGPDEALAITATTDGGFAVAGFSNGDFWIIKLDSNGSLQWENLFGGTLSEFAYTIIQTSDGGYAVGGASSSSNGDVTSNYGWQDYWLLKLDATGNLQWEQSYGGSSTDECYSVIQTSDGGYALAGSANSADHDITASRGATDYWFVKTDSEGNLQWQKSFGGTGADYARSVIQTLDGGYIIAGSTASNDGDVTGWHENTGDGQYFDYWVIKISSSGDLQWQKALGGTGSDEAWAVVEAPDGGSIVVGRAGTNNGDVVAPGGGYCWIVKLDELGNIAWQQSVGSTEAHSIRAAVYDQSGALVIAGSSDGTYFNPGESYGFIDMWLIKLNPAPLSLNGHVVSEGILYPNPVKSMLYFESSKMNVLSTQVFDSTGKMIFENSNSGAFLTNIDIEHLSTGVYVVKLMTPEGEKIFKVIKE